MFSSNKLDKIYLQIPFKTVSLKINVAVKQHRKSLPEPIAVNSLYLLLKVPFSKCEIGILLMGIVFL